MTEKELHRLKRHDLLELLVEQGKENVQLKQRLAETEEELEDMKAWYEKIRNRLELKDKLIQDLQKTLEAEKEKRRIELEEAGSIAEAALRLSGIFETAQKAADLYLHNIKLLHDEQMPDNSPEGDI